MSRSRKFVPCRKTKNACDVNVPGVVDKQRKYMTVNLSLIVGHIREVESGFSFAWGMVYRVGGMRGWSCMVGEVLKPREDAHQSGLEWCMWCRCKRKGQK